MQHFFVNHSLRFYTLIIFAILFCNASSAFAQCSFTLTTASGTNYSSADGIFFICESDIPATLVAGQVGGVFSGVGTIGNTFNPLVVPNTYTIKYTFGACSLNINAVIQVSSIKAVIDAVDPNFCQNDPPITLTGNVGVNGTFQVNGVNAINFNPQIAGVGSHKIKYSYIDAGVTGCVSTDSAIFNVLALPDVTISGLNATYCESDAPVQISGVSVANAGVFSGPGIIEGGSTTPTLFDPAIAGIGTHTITHTYSDLQNICTNQTTFEVTVTPTLLIDFKIPETVCANMPFTVTYTGSPLPPDASIVWTIDNNGVILLNNADSAVIQYSSAGQKNIILNVQGLTCTPNPAIHSINVSTGVTLSAGDDQTINKGQIVELSADAQSDAGNNFSYTWTPADNILNNSQTQTIKIQPQNSTVFTVKATDSNGCFALDSLQVNISILHDVFIPNAFTPNNDNNNDVFKIFGNEIEKIQLQIFDRWGGLVFETSDPNFEWDGTFKERDLGAAVFVYTAKITFTDAQTISKKGSITLIK